MMDNDCPICHCTGESHSDHPSGSYCELCGISINAPERSAFTFEEEGKTVHFCCERCRSIFIKEIINNNECIDIIRKQRYFDILEEYDDVVKDMLILYINRKYPKDGERNSGGEEEWSKQAR